MPSASEVGRAPKYFVHLRDKANILNHRPINNHAAPLPLMHEAFGEFMDLFNTGVPTHSDCKFAIDLCKVASEVGLCIFGSSIRHFVALQMRFQRCLFMQNMSFRHPDSLRVCLGVDR